MQIKDLKPKLGNVDIVIDVVDVGDAREFNKFGKPGKVATAIAKDETGDVKLTLWNDDIEKVKAGDKVHLTNGYVNEWQGELQLTTGKFGTMEVLGSSSDNKVDAVTADEIEEKDALEWEKDTEEHVLTEDEKTEGEENLDVEEEDIS